MIDEAEQVVSKMSDIPAKPRVSRRLAAVLAADIAGYSALMGADEETTVRDLKAHQAVVLPMIAEHGGRIIDTAGDGILAEFGSVVNAVECAIAIQKAMVKRNASVEPGRQMRFRIGINLGDVIHDDARVYGDGVNIAARLESIAEPGGICISGDAHSQVQRKLQLQFTDLGEQQLKNIAQTVRVYRVGSAQPAFPSERLALALPDKPSIAVLPFDNMSGDPEQAYFADGIAEDLITGLSRISWFFVIARNSSFAFRGEKQDIRTICHKLGVRYVVEGSVRKAGSRVRVTAQLIDGTSGAHLWADKYDGPLDQIFELQDKITESLIGAIEPKLRGVEIARAHRRRPESMNAFDLLLQALPHHWAMSQEGFNDAIKLLDHAIELAPTYAEALGYAAACRAFRPLHNCSPDPGRDFREADELVQRALEADPVDPVVLRSAAFVVVLDKRDFETAFDLIARSLAVDQNSALTWGYRGWISVWAGNQDDAIVDFDKALRLSPFDQWISTYSVGRSFALIMSGRIDEGLRWARRAMQENPDWTASYRGLAAGLVLNGKLEEARTVAAKLTKLDPSFSVRRWVETAPFRRTDGQERFFKALQTAGLPE